MIKLLFERLSHLPEVEAIALGGSRAGNNYDEKSDYDVYVYCSENIDEKVRKNIFTEFCSRTEIGNSFWEYEDNCTLKNGTDIDIIYRNLQSFCEELSSVIENYGARNGYTTCLWHNLITCKTVFDRSGLLEAAKKRFNVPYPERLRTNIIARNLKLLHTAMPAYDTQISKAVKRGDLISINHRITAYLESYFDIIFALNRMSHPGEKRLIEICKSNCGILPVNFEENLTALFTHLYTKPDLIKRDLGLIYEELQKVINL